MPRNIFLGITVASEAGESVFVTIRAMKKILAVSLLSFVLNFFWEISQAFLYAPHFVGLSGLILVHAHAALGDILMILLMLMADDIIFRHIFSGDKKNRYRTVAVMFTGFMLAVAVEKYALATGRWAYGPFMPIIPWFDVGLTPILQMVLIPPCVFAVWLRLRKEIHGYKKRPE